MKPFSYLAQAPLKGLDLAAQRLDLPAHALPVLPPKRLLLLQVRQLLIHHRQVRLVQPNLQQASTHIKYNTTASGGMCANRNDGK
jgi:hypothetical protein